MKTIEEIQHELWFKEQRVTYWEKHHSIPTLFDIKDGSVVL